jgi:hemerythrin
MAIIWNENLSVKIELFDSQHKKLVDLINGFYEKAQSGKGPENFLFFTKALKDYAVYHFTAEEDLMKTHNFEGYENHKLEHTIFIEQITFYEEKFKTGKDITVLAVLNYIKDWIINHVMGTDRKYSDFLVSKGIN